MVGRTLSRYRIVDEISRGGMGVVYRAVDVSLEREVAIKVLPDDIARDPVRRDRLLQEARAASALEHPHVAVIHEAGTADGVTFIVMELIRGEKLSELLARGPLPHTRALTLAAEVAEGLSRAHEKGIVHRDLKPANVMVTDDGHAKIIDFGLAKVVELGAPDSMTATIDGPRTAAGVVLGTAAYMAPEQARGDRVDARTDVFALGVTLYEMITGRPAFQGRSTIDTMQAVLTQPVPPLSAGAAASADTAAELGRIIAKCTAKEPDDRYQGMRDLIVDLRAVRRRSESSQTAAVMPGLARHPGRFRLDRRALRLAAGLVVAAGIAAAAFVWWTRGPKAGPTPPGKPGMAVLYFENNTGDPSLDWLRSGLTDMMVTDLSQSRDVEVLGTDRLVQILQELRRADDRVTSADVVKEIAARAGVDNVLVGSYLKAGDTIRISARLQDARTGRILSAQRVEGTGEAAIFSLVDDLTRRFRATLADLTSPGAGSLLTRPHESSPNERGLDRGVTEITTSSVEAYRFYAEGLAFHDRGMSAQAVPLLERAIAIDRDFAMAHAKLAVVSGNLRLLDKRDEHARRAVALVGRLSSRERYYIEGYYYGLRPATLARSIEAYERGLQLHPEHQASRHNLALHMLELERFPEAIEQYEELLRRGTSMPHSYGNLAGAYIQSGNFPRARAVGEALARKQPDNAVAARTLGEILLAEGRLDEAMAAFEKAHALDPLDNFARAGSRNVALLQGRWDVADAAAREMTTAAIPFVRFVGLTSLANIAGVYGREEPILEALDRAAGLEGLAPVQRSTAHIQAAVALLRRGDAAAALRRAELALKDVEGHDPEPFALQILAAAQGAAVSREAAERTIGRLESRAKELPSTREVRRVHWVRGVLALSRGDAGTAAGELDRALQMLPPYGRPIGGAPHARLWLDAADALSRAGRDADAARLLERLQTRYERVHAMDAYARSFFLLGRIEERRGHVARAREQYARFLELWRNGDMERGWVAEAERKLTSLPASGSTR